MAKIKRELSENSKFVDIPFSIFGFSNLNLNEKLLLGRINSLNHKSKGCYAGNDSFCKHLGLSKSQIKTLITSLVIKKYLTRIMQPVNDNPKNTRRILRVKKKYADSISVNEVLRVPSIYWNNNDLDNIQMIILARINSLSQKSNVCSIDNQSFVEMVGLSYGRIQKRITKLTENQYISRIMEQVYENQKNTSRILVSIYPHNISLKNFLPHVENRPPHVGDSPPPCRRQSTPMSETVHPHVGDSPQNTLYNNKVNNKVNSIINTHFLNLNGIINPAEVDMDSKHINSNFLNLKESINPDTLNDSEKKERINLIHNELKNSESWLIDLRRISNLNHTENWHMVKQFLDELKAKDDYFKSLPEIKKHCVSWIRKYKPVIINKN